MFEVCILKIYIALYNYIYICIYIHMIYVYITPDYHLHVNCESYIPTSRACAELRLLQVDPKSKVACETVTKDCLKAVV